MFVYRKDECSSLGCSYGIGECVLSTSALTCKTFGSTGSCSQGGPGAYSRRGCTGLMTSSSDHSQHTATDPRPVSPSYHGFADPDLKVNISGLRLSRDWTVLNAPYACGSSERVLWHKNVHTGDKCVRPLQCALPQCDCTGWRTW